MIFIYYSSLSACKIVIFHNKNSQRKGLSWYLDLNWHIKSLYFLKEADLQYDRVKEKKFNLLALASKTSSTSSVHHSASHLCDPMNCSPPDSFVYGILQARIQEWVAISCSRGSSQLRDGTCVSCISCTGRQILYCWDTR